MGRRTRQVKGLLARGLSRREVAERLGLARTTVDYHANRPEEPPAGAQPPLAGSAVILVDTRGGVAALLAQGMTRAQIARELGLSKGTVSYHARRLGETIDDRCARRYDWAEVQRFYDEGFGVRECARRFGFSRQSWTAAVRRGEIKARPPHLPLPELLRRGVYRSRHNVKVRLLNEGLKTNECEACGLREWRGRPLSVALHHVNGDRLDNRLENLALLCPNCHSQTDTFSGKKRVM